mmetsp:Transcript_5541/g.8716  ORF Transcript_5541/g.8716 Transcript_5541/m.8716 type:complete len:80 (+) Transcript_5541:790-1029(+)
MASKRSYEAALDKKTNRPTKQKAYYGVPIVQQYPGSNMYETARYNSISSLQNSMTQNPVSSATMSLTQSNPPHPQKDRF